jgi:acyl-CoA synthetase (AMP-forming)/AMP-acid ligase II
VEQCPDGSLGLVGRVREMFKSGGYNVYPREVELALERLPGVQAAAVLPVPDDLYGEVGHAFVVCPGLDGDDLLRSARTLLAPYKVPKQLTVVEALPLLPVGKVDKVALRSGLVAVG